jgi:hypothetical protein
VGIVWARSELAHHDIVELGVLVCETGDRYGTSDPPSLGLVCRSFSARS